VFDLYETALRRYREELFHWERSSRDSSDGYVDGDTKDP